MTLDEQFTDAQARVKTLPKMPDNDQLLELYALYKQATAGDVSGKAPGMFDLKGGAKHSAWSRKKGMSGEQAKTAYVKYVDKLLGK